MSEPDRYWFPAKRYGWGWGLPSRWQGWTTLLGYSLLSALGYWVFALPEGMLAFMTYQFVLATALLLVCWKKGEPPRWRWEDDKPE